jgi:hypothetical protein
MNDEHFHPLKSPVEITRGARRRRFSQPLHAYGTGPRREHEGPPPVTLAADERSYRDVRFEA